MIIFGEASLRRSIGEFVEHYHSERPHQGLQNELIERVERRPATGTLIRCHERLGGLLRAQPERGVAMGHYASGPASSASRPRESAAFMAGQGT
jgi:hypothetical protein